MANRKRQLLLFISHSSEDRELAACLLKTLHTFYDIPDESIRATSLVGYGLPGGANIADTLKTEIRSAKAVIGILTPNSIASPWVLYELGAVWGLASNFVPLIAGLDPTKLVSPLRPAHICLLPVVYSVTFAMAHFDRN